MENSVVRIKHLPPVTNTVIYTVNEKTGERTRFCVRDADGRLIPGTMISEQDFIKFMQRTLPPPEDPAELKRKLDAWLQDPGPDGYAAQARQAITEETAPD